MLIESILQVVVRFLCYVVQKNNTGLVRLVTDRMIRVLNAPQEAFNNKCKFFSR